MGKLHLIRDSVFNFITYSTKSNNIYHHWYAILLLVTCANMTILTRTGKNSSQIAERYNLVITRGQSESHSVMSDSLQTHGLYSPWNSSGQNTGVGSLFLLQGIFPIQGSNPGLPHCRQIFLSVEPQRPKYRSFSMGRLLCCFPFLILSLFCSVWLGAVIAAGYISRLQSQLAAKEVWSMRGVRGERTVGEINQAHFPLSSAVRCNSSGDYLLCSLDLRGPWPLDSGSITYFLCFCGG